MLLGYKNEKIFFIRHRQLEYQKYWTRIFPLSNQQKLTVIKRSKVQEFVKIGDRNIIFLVSNLFQNNQRRNIN